jgi:hypothetical protein
MLCLKNLSDEHDGTFAITADGKSLPEIQIQLPPKYESQNYFADIPFLAKELTATINFNRHSESVEAALHGAWPVIESRSSLSSELRQIIDVFTRHRPVGESSPHISVQRSSNPIATTEPTAFVADDSSAQQRGLSPVAPVVADSPLTRSIDWPDVLSQSRFASTPPGDWQPLVTVSRIPVLAIRELPVRQVWVGFDSDQFPHRADFVVFWTAVFDWLGNAALNYNSSPPNDPTVSASTVPQPAKSLAGQSLLVACLFFGLSASTWKPTPFTHHKPGIS